MFCMNCGKQLRDGSSFCPYCGTDLSIVAALDAQDSEATCYQPSYQPEADATFYQAPAQSPAYEAAHEATYYQAPAQNPVYGAAPNANYYQPAQQPASQPYYAAAPQPRYEPAPQPYYVPAPAPAEPPRRKKKRKGLILGLSLTLTVLLLAGAAAFLFLSGAFAGPNAAVGNALRKSTNAYTKAAEFAPKYDLSGLKETKGYSSILTAKLHELNIDFEYPALLSMLKGAVVKVNHEFSETEREATLSVTPSLGSADLATASLLLEDDRLAVTCPEFLGDEVYGVNTETIGADIYNLGILGPEEQSLSYIGFNLFDLIEDLRAVLEDAKVSEESLAELKTTCLTMFTEAEIEKIGEDVIDVNGTDVECMEYSVLISEDAIGELYDVFRDTILEIDREKLARDLVETILSNYLTSEELVAEAMASFEYTDNTKDMLDSIKDFLKELEDLEFTIWLAKGYVMSVRCEDTLYDTDFDVTIDLGGGEEYADMLSVEFNIDDEDLTVTLESSGDHSAKSGTFTDETVLEIEIDGDTMEFTVETEYEPKSGAFSVSANAMDTTEVSIRGMLTGGENTFDLNLEKVDVEIWGEELVSFGLSLAVSPYEQRISVSNPTMLSDLTEDDIYDIMDEISSAAQTWAMDLVAQYPELMTMFF